MATPSGEVAQMLESATSKQELNREAGAALLRVRTGPECPEGNLRELTWDRNPNCGITREREKKKRENFAMKSPNLRHCQACSQNKGLSEYQRRDSPLRTGPSPAGGREAARAGKGQSRSQRGHPLPNCEQAPSC